MSPRGNHTPPRSGLRLSDLKQRGPVARKLMNVKLPAELANAIDRLAEHLDASKAETVLMLLNEGLARARAGRR